MHRPANTIEVWLARPAQVAEGQWPICEALLDPLERERALRLRLRADRDSWVLAHALRRLVLGNWLDLPPAALRLVDRPGVKPVLLAPARHGLHFSHSRRRQLVAFAVTRLAPVGIDVEEIRPQSADFALLARHMVVTELEMSAAASGERARSFFACWTALEAFWKAQGTGLATGNPRLRCRRNTDGPREISLEPSGLRAARWWPIASRDDHAVALALMDSHAGGVAPGEVALTLRDGNQLIGPAGMALRSYDGPAQADRGLR